MPRWDYEYRYAGHRLTEQRVAVTWTERASVLDSTVFVSRVNIEINPPFDFAATATNANPASGFGVLYRVADDGTTIAVFRGEWTDVRFGGSQDPVQITMSNSIDDDVALIPEAYELNYGTDEVLEKVSLWYGGSPHNPYIDSTSWPDSVALVDLGSTYTWIFGGPGNDDAPGSPTKIVDESGGNYTIMIAGHRTNLVSFDWWYEDADPAVGGKRVRTTAFTDTDIDHVLDGRGRTVTVFDTPTGAISIDKDNDGGYFMSWTGGDAAPGGAGDVIRRAMRSSSQRFDVLRSGPALERLNSYQLDGYIDEQVAPLEWVSKTIMPLLPASLHSGADGIYVKLWPWIDDIEEYVHDLYEGSDFAAASLVSYGAASAGSVTLRYQWRPDKGVYLGAVTASAKNTLFGAQASAISPRTETMETRAVWDDDTAQAIVMDRIRYGAIPSRIRRYTVDPSKYGIGGSQELRVGMPVKITDAEVSWTGLLAWVDEIERTGDAMSVQLRIREW